MKNLLILLSILALWYIVAEIGAYWLSPQYVLNDTDDGRDLRAGCFLSPVLLVMGLLAYLQWTLQKIAHYFGVASPPPDNFTDYIP